MGLPAITLPEEDAASTRMREYLRDTLGLTGGYITPTEGTPLFRHLINSAITVLSMVEFHDTYAEGEAYFRGNRDGSKASAYSKEAALLLEREFNSRGNESILDATPLTFTKPSGEDEKCTAGEINNAISAELQVVGFDALCKARGVTLNTGRTVQ